MSEVKEWAAVVLAIGSALLAFKIGFDEASRRAVERPACVTALQPQGNA